MRYFADRGNLGMAVVTAYPPAPVVLENSAPFVADEQLLPFGAELLTPQCLWALLLFWDRRAHVTVPR